MVRLKICRVAELAPGTARRIEPEGAEGVAVFNVDNQFYAIADTCTHQEYPLSDGYIEGEEMECALHLARYNLRTGEALCPPATHPVKTYPVEVDGDEIFVRLDTES
jgi:3-phenylpropionate/trans-cinnamate dioxygenase ferredoxin component